jgi:hypothetical protein
VRRGEHYPAGIQPLVSVHIFLSHALDRPFFSGKSLEPDCHPLGITIPAVVGAARATVDGAGRPLFGAIRAFFHEKTLPKNVFWNLAKRPLIEGGLQKL